MSAQDDDEFPNNVVHLRRQPFDMRDAVAKELVDMRLQAYEAVSVLAVVAATFPGIVREGLQSVARQREALASQSPHASR